MLVCGLIKITMLQYTVLFLWQSTPIALLVKLTRQLRREKEEVKKMTQENRQLQQQLDDYKVTDSGGITLQGPILCTVKYIYCMHLHQE